MTSTKICPTCGTEYPATERFCPKDGTALRAAAAAETDLVGSVIAERYHVLRKLGEGGMGQVYLAEHVKMGRQSAVKVMHQTMVHDTAAIGRFNREAANASRIDHPNVAGIYDFGETPEGLVYLAMQYIEGETLTHIVQGAGALAPARAAEVVRQAAEGLHAAHALGIVHRDLKPDNIMVTKDADGLDCVKVVDFGIAKAAGRDAQRVTKTGIVVGTPDYMSPEQLSGKEVDARSDLYSLALVAFHLLTGELPFPSASTQTSMVMRLTDKPKSLAEMKPEVAWPAEVEAVMSRALALEPADRYATTREFGRALHAAIGQMPEPAATTAASAATATTATTAPRARTAPAAAKPGRREIVIAAGIVGVLAAVVVAVLVWRGGAAGVGAGSGAFEQGVAAYREGRRAAAAQHFLAAAGSAPGDAMPHVYLSRIARESNDLTTANVEALTAVRLGPENAAALRELATVSFVQQNYAGARTFYARAVKADPADRLSQGFLGCSLIRLGRVDEGTRWVVRAGDGPWSSCAVGR
jgi:tetratricopeptide (TPR) repeat protein